MSKKLKHCPYCLSMPVVKAVAMTDKGISWAANCTNCSLETNHVDSAEKAVAHWNERIVKLGTDREEETRKSRWKDLTDSHRILGGTRYSN